MKQLTFSDISGSATASPDGDSESDSGVSIDVPTPPPTNRSPVSDEELRAAVNDMLESMVLPGEQPKHHALRELPRWLDESEIPDTYACDDPSLSGPDHCPECGLRGPYSRPLERGYAIEIETETGNPRYDHCPDGKYNIQSCTCCGCPSCGAKSIYRRSRVYPPYRCRNPRCGAEFEYPIERFDSDEIRRKLYWECWGCETPIPAPFEGVPDEFFNGDSSQTASESQDFSNPMERRG